MTKKDYELIAAAFKRTTPLCDQHGDMKNAIVNNVAASLAAENPRFNRDRFIEACK